MLSRLADYAVKISVIGLSSSLLSFSLLHEARCCSSEEVMTRSTMPSGTFSFSLLCEECDDRFKL